MLINSKNANTENILYCVCRSIPQATWSSPVHFMHWWGSLECVLKREGAVQFAHSVGSARSLLHPGANRRVSNNQPTLEDCSKSFKLFQLSYTVLVHRTCSVHCRSYAVGLARSLEFLRAASSFLSYIVMCTAMVSRMLILLLLGWNGKLFCFYVVTVHHGCLATEGHARLPRFNFLNDDAF